MDPSALLLGVGNILLADEGVGVRVVEAFQRRYGTPEGVDVLDGGTAGMELLDALSGRSHIVIVDAVRTGAEPGTIVRLTGNNVPALFSNRISPHQLGISDVLAMLRLIDQEPGHIALIGIVPADLDPGLELSSAIAGRIDEMVELVASELRGQGFIIKPSEPCFELMPEGPRAGLAESRSELPGPRSRTRRQPRLRDENRGA